MQTSQPSFVCGGYLDNSVGNAGQSQSVTGCQAIYSTGGNWTIYLDPAWGTNASLMIKQFLVTVGPINGTPNDSVNSPIAIINSTFATNNPQGQACIAYVFSYFNAKTATVYSVSPPSANFHFKIEKLPSNT